MNEHNDLLYPLLNDDPVYCHGFEAGLLHDRLDKGENVRDQIVHTDNVLQLEMICAHFCDRDEFKITRIDEMWSELSAKPRTI